MPDDDGTQKKRIELAQMIADALAGRIEVGDRSALTEAIGGLLAIGVTIRPPHRPKPGNVLVDMRKLLVTGAKMVCEVVGTVKSPLLLPLTALILWDQFWSLIKVEITEYDASVIWAMWTHCDAKQTIADAGLLETVNRMREEKEHGPLSAQELRDSLDKLAKMRCIELWNADPSRWWLREWIKVEYR
jgi:hypothetical protein